MLLSTHYAILLKYSSKQISTSTPKKAQTSPLPSFTLRNSVLQNSHLQTNSRIWIYIIKFAKLKSIDYICTQFIKPTFNQFTKVTIMDLVNRLKLFMDDSDITISQFADACQIPRPTMSQILNGRNKRVSDELIAKIHQTYPQLSVLWLLFGEGDMCGNENIEISEPQNQSSDDISQTQISENQFEADSNILFSTSQNLDSENPDDQNRTEFGQIFGQNNETASANNTNFNFSNHSTIDFDPEPNLFQASENVDFNALGTRPTEQPDNYTGATPSSSINVTNSRPELQPNTTPSNGSHSATQTASVLAAVQSAIQQTSNAPTSNGMQTPNTNNTTSPIATGKQITTIVVFYSDNSFQSFSPTV